MLGFLGVGLFYGLLMLTNSRNQDVLYLTGHWNFREKKCAVFLVVTWMVVAGVPGLVLGVLVPLLIKIAVVEYVCLALAASWSSFSMVYVLSRVQNKYNWIAYESVSSQ